MSEQTASQDHGEVPHKMGTAEVIEKLYTIASHLKIPQQLGLLAEGKNNQANSSTRRGRCYEGASLDYYYYLGNCPLVLTNIETMNDAEKIAYLDGLPGKERKGLVQFSIHKLASVSKAAPWEESGAPTAQVAISVTPEQQQRASFLEISWREDLSIFTILPNPGLRIIKFPHRNPEAAVLPGPLVPFTIPRQYAKEAIARLQAAIKQKANSFRMPYLNIDIPLVDWDARLQSYFDEAYPRRNRDDPNVKAFLKFQEAIDRCVDQRKADWRLDFSCFRPYGGHGDLKDGNLPSKLHEFKALPLIVDPDNPGYHRLDLIPAKNQTMQRRTSPFHPARQWHYLAVFHSNWKKLLYLPCSEITISMWSGLPYALIPTPIVERYTVNNTSDDRDWIGDVCQIMYHDDFTDGIPLRPPNYLNPDHVVQYSAAAALLSDGASEESFETSDEALEKGEEDHKHISSKFGPLQHSNGYSYPKEVIGQVNTRCAAKGRGILIPTGFHPQNKMLENCVLPQAIYIPGYKWTRDQKETFWAINRLPLIFHTGDIHPSLLVIPILISNSAPRDVDVGGNVCHFSSVLATPPFPSLYLLKGDPRELREWETDCKLIPSEFLRDKVFAYQSDTHIDLLRSLGDLRLGHFTVRDGLQTWESLEEFASAHGSHQTVPWYCPQDGTTAEFTENYYVPMRTILQEAANFYGPQFYRGT